jgi:hypothetical protein
MTYPVEQRDSSLLIPRGIPITTQNKFRNQHIVITIAVPVGKRIKIDKKIGWGGGEHFQFAWTDNREDYDWDDESFSWYNHKGEELIMKEDGLYTLDGKSTAEDWGRSRRHYKRYGVDNDRDVFEEKIDSGYRYDQTQKAIDSLKVVKQRQVQKLKDSLQRKKEELERKLEKIEQNDGNEAFTRDSQRFDFVLSI